MTPCRFRAMSAPQQVADGPAGVRLVAQYTLECRARVARDGARDADPVEARPGMSAAAAFSYSSAFVSAISSRPLAPGPERARFFGVGVFCPSAARAPGEAALAPVPLGLLARSTPARKASMRSMALVGSAAGSAFPTVSPAALAFTSASTSSRKESWNDSGSHSMARVSIDCTAISPPPPSPRPSPEGREPRRADRAACRPGEGCGSRAGSPPPPPSARPGTPARASRTSRCWPSPRTSPAAPG